MWPQRLGKESPFLKFLISITRSNGAGPVPIINIEKRSRKITFNEYVHSIEDDQLEPLKGREALEDDVGSAKTSEENGCKEQDVSNWVLESLRHCSPTTSMTSSTSSSTTITANSVISNANPLDANRPKIYNGRTVPNCFSPEEVQQRLVQHHDIITHSTTPNLGPVILNGRKPPPAPPPRRL